MTAVIALSKCAQTKKMYGIRFERTRRDWKYTWAFPIQEKAALHEEYDKTTITGALIKEKSILDALIAEQKDFFTVAAAN